MDGKIENYDKIFLPGSPVKDRRYLVGREQEIIDLKNILKRSGQHAIVIGDRGVGKTSLVKLVLDEKEYNDCWRTCDTNTSFTDVFKSLLQRCGVDFRGMEETNETSLQPRPGAPLLACNVWLEDQIGSLSDLSHYDHLYWPWRERYRALRGRDPVDPKRSFLMAVKGCLDRLAARRQRQ